MNDIALIKLSTNVTLTNYIQVACLPIVQSSNYPRDQIDVWTAGWGDTNENGTISYILNNIKLTIYYDNKKCERTFSDIPKYWDRQICIGDINGGRDTCDDDGGGALFIKDTIDGKRKNVIAALVGYSLGCARPGKVIILINYLKKKIDKLRVIFFI